MANASAAFFMSVRITSWAEAAVMRPTGVSIVTIVGRKTSKVASPTSQAAAPARSPAPSAQIARRFEAGRATQDDRPTRQSPRVPSALPLIEQVFLTCSGSSTPADGASAGRPP